MGVTVPVALCTSNALAGPIANSWARSTQIEGPAAPNPACEKLESTIHAKIAGMARLRASIDKLEKKGPQSVKGLLQGWIGQPVTSKKVRDQEAKVERERAAVKDLNGIAASLGCTQLDIEKELKLESAKLQPLESFEH